MLPVRAHRTGKKHQKQAQELEQAVSVVRPTPGEHKKIRALTKSKRAEHTKQNTTHTHTHTHKPENISRTLFLVFPYVCLLCNTFGNDVGEQLK